MADLWGENDDEEVDGAGRMEEEEEEEEEEDILDAGEETGVQEQDALLMRFCPHDSSMLYPQANVCASSTVESILSQEDKRNKALQYACRLCRYTEPAADQPLVYRNERKKEVGNILHTVPSAISDDPTLARSSTASCANCGHNEAVFFQSDVAQSDSLALIFVCCNCDHKWVS